MRSVHGLSGRVWSCIVLAVFFSFFLGLPRPAHAAVTNYTITMTSGAGGTISYGTGSGTKTSTNGTAVNVSVPDNQNATFTITPNTGYIVQAITVDGSAVNIASQYTFFKTITSNHTITVTFIAQWTVTATANSGGSIAPSGSQTVLNGATPSFTATADSSHYVASITINMGGATTTLTPAAKTVSYPFTLAGVAANTTVTASFSARPSYTISTEVWSLISGAYYISTAGGSVTPTSATVFEGGSVTFTATPASGYALRGIFVGCNSCSEQPAISPFTLTNVTANTEVWFRFRPATQSITATAHPGGTITPAGVTETSNFGTYSYTITPNAGYDITSVNVCDTSTGTCSTSSFGQVTNTGTNVTITTPTDSYTIDASFAIHNYNFTTTIAWNPAAAAPSPVPSGTVSPTSATVAYGGSSPTFTFTPPSGWYIQGVTDTSNGVTTNLGAVTSWSWTNVSADHAIQVTFGQRSAYHIYVTNGGNGTITNSAGLLPASAPAGTTDYTVYTGDTVTFTFAANAGYVIKNVVVDNVSLGPITRYTFANAGTDHAISVSFINAYSITATAGAHGSISPAGTVWVSSGASKTFSITPDSGYSIQDVLVNGSSVGPVASYTFSNVTASGQTISATFSSSGVPLSTYCDLPPYISGNVRPNLLLLLDNSASMYDLAYTSTSTFCFDDTYDDTASYVGYFNQGTLYSYDPLNNVFNGGATMPAGGCNDVTTGYVCVSMTGTAPGRTVNQFVASGKFLNWLSASKLDVEKQALTGGKYDAMRSVLVGETRGCLGKRFVKMITDPSTNKYFPITFATRGPGAFEADFTNPVSQGGTTRIEIYDGTYNASACQAAVTDWQNLSLTGTGTMGQIDNETVSCLGGSGNKVSDQVANYQHQMHNCYWFFANHSLSNDNTLQNNCASLYNNYYNHDPSQIVNPAAADAICSSVLTHPLFTPPNNSSPNTSGYIGKCATYSGNKWTWDDNCTVTEMEDFCTNISANDVSDPSTSNYITGTTMSVPSFLTDAGVTPLGNAAGTYLVNISQPAPPTGLIDQFKTLINFGAMIFNFDGTASECGQTGDNINCPKVCSVTTSQQCVSNSDCPSGESCTTGTTRDGGQIISYVNYDPVGDHTTGLISSIDGIQATSWTPFAEAFYNAIGYFANRTDLRLNSGDFDASKPPSQYSCQKNNVLLVTDGMSTADRNSAVMTLASQHPSPSYNAATAPGNLTTSSTAWNAAPTYAGSTNLDDLAWLAQHKSIVNFSNNPANDSQKITTHVIYSGAPCASVGATGTCTSNDETIPEVELQHTAAYGGGLFQLANAGSLQQNLLKAFQLIATQASSGTAASILSNSEGSGANILQAIFYPKKTFDNGATNVNWIGEMHNLWYYVDPFIGKSTVRENTADPSTAAANTKYFNLEQDYEVRFDYVDNQTIVHRWQDTDGDGLGDLYVDDITPDQLNSLWRAGRQLWARTSARTIYTQLGSGLVNLTSVDTSQTANQTLLQATSQSEADRIVNFVEGYMGGTEDPGYRSRMVAIPPPVGTDSTARIWRLGDIISSTPRVQSSIQLGNYNLSPSAGYNDISYTKYVQQTNYTSYNIDYPNRGMAYVGANDGMLHAFKMGSLSVVASGDQKATLSGAYLGEEQWAFIPQNALPYLKYTADKNYSHVYFVDGPTLLVDASIGNPSGCSGNYWDCGKDMGQGTNWKSVLIGSMGLGGSSRNAGESCNGGTTNCVKSPIANGGYSAYFALDITNQSFDTSSGALRGQPTFLWEFSNSGLGYATSGPAIVKIDATTGGVPDASKNGHWYAVFASGPTGPIDSSVCQFKGYSDQTLKIFVVDLQSGQLKKTFDMNDYGLTATAFAGSITNGVIDSDRWNKNSTGFYQDDAIYIPYVKQAADGTWTDGGIIRLVTKEDPDPTNWAPSLVIDGIGPVTTNVAKLQDRKNHHLWLYFGTGRYYYGNDDPATQRKLFGIMEPCYTTSDMIDKTCTSSRSFPSDLTNQSGNSPSATLGTLANAYLDNKGWYVNLDGQDTTNNYGAERVITDPVAMTNGVVYFTTFEPTTDACKSGGQSFMWALKYDTGFTPPAAALQGKALVQVSTGSFQQIDLSGAFTTKGGRKTGSAMTGKPPSDPPPIVTKSNLKPVKKILHIQEK